MEKEYKEYSYFDVDPKKGWGFILALASLLLFTVMGMGIDIDEYLQHEYLNIPRWYFYVIFTIDALMIISLVLMFFYRKIGMFAFPVLLVLHFLMHNYYLSTFLYTDVTNLFLFTGFGMLAIIPKWKFFK
ncbi:MULTISPECIES: hypothetical protein [Chryseobacterium]|uniref:DoxX-like family protein n=1 Tax=Chryseobacterium scophthalmum TaxID=59733 RepID=A0A1N6IMA2_9FLAO|nr:MULTISPECIES: hypothetical protein [Chryseobacterium]MBM7421490.1 hypothetical protein [Chryseobacterium sp. JUb44]MDH6211455.1 hypothetical protein [Chryseobacterium sp. BIGb0186]WSO10103.1 hypothetical protein VUJ64_20000 [Chryseobacterium scophthalmum]SIO33095.1 hypothetical protein SAMN05421769_3554 [Chryseobacterium scophthalmum]